jgi:hypothetical protein
MINEWFAIQVGSPVRQGMLADVIDCVDHIAASIFFH